MSSGKIVLAGVQLAGLPKEKERNIEVAEQLIRQAAALGAQIVMTPEVVTTGFVGGQAEREMAELFLGGQQICFLHLQRNWGFIF